ncbi:MAG TPA: S41 family peptidase [Gemmataceae bacterium]
MTRSALLPRRAPGLALFALLLLASPAVRAQDGLPAGEVSPERLRAQARELEEKGRWELALEAYCRLAELDRRYPDLREAIHRCLRHVLRDRRYRDPSIREKILTLSPHQALELYAEVVAKLQSHYYRAEASGPQELLRHGLEEFEAALQDPVFRERHLRSPSDASVAAFRERLHASWDRRAVRTAGEARTAVREVALAAQRHFRMPSPVPVVVEFLCGACNALDEYTAYLSPDQLLAELAQPGPDLLAFGVRLGITGGELVVAEVRPGSIADAQFLLREGDRVVGVNGRPVGRATAESVAALLRQRRGPYLELEIVPADGAPPRSVSLPVDLPTVVGSTMLKEGVGYLRLLSFRESTPAELDDAILSLRMQGMKALILDLRGSPGGLFLIAVELSERFLAGGVIVSTQGQADEFNRTYASAGGPNALTVPLVVLIDSDTASAAEILAAALKENERALLVGTPTYGKGTMQRLLYLKTAEEVDEAGRTVPRAGALRLTVARFFSPGGTPLAGAGIIPHIIEPVPARQMEVALAQATRLAMGEP